MGGESEKQLNPHDIRVGGKAGCDYLMFLNPANAYLSHSQYVEILRLARVGYYAEQKQREELEELLLRQALSYIEALIDYQHPKLEKISVSMDESDKKALQFFVYKFKSLHCEKT